MSATEQRSGGGRRRRPPRPVEVVAAERLTPRLVSVVFGGDALEGFPDPPPTAHIKVFLPDADGRLALPTAGRDGLAWPEGRPTMRTCTPRRYDAAANRLEVQFVLHGDGPASRWAEQAAPGHRVAIGGPGGRFVPDPSAGHWWIGGDESALPAVATLLEALPPTTTAEVHLEVEGVADRIPLPAGPCVNVVWHERRGDAPDRWGGELVAAAEAAGLGAETPVWVACEAAAVRRLRAHLLADRSLPRAQVTTRGYWRLGEANHPDHDFGED